MEKSLPRNCQQHPHSRHPPTESRFNEKLHSAVRDFYCRDDNSTSLPRKRDFKKVKSKRFQRRLLNDFLKNLHLKFLAKKLEQTIPSSVVARLRPAHFKLENFKFQSSCLCVKHQNISLKRKVLKSKGITIFSNLDVFINHYDTNSITKKSTSRLKEQLLMKCGKRRLLK